MSCFVSNPLIKMDKVETTIGVIFLVSLLSILEMVIFTIALRAFQRLSAVLIKHVRANSNTIRGVVLG
jgi:hypothetical protein